MFLKLKCASKSPEDSDPVGPGWGWRFHISNKVPCYISFKDFYKSL